MLYKQARRIGTLARVLKNLGAGKLAEYLSHKVNEKRISFPEDEIPLLKNQDRIFTTRVSDDFRRYGVGDTVITPWGDRFMVESRDVIPDIKSHPFLDKLTPGQAAEIGKHKNIAGLWLKKSAVPTEDTIKKQAEVPSYNHVVAGYSKNPVKSLERLAEQLAEKKWSPADVVREDAAHDEEYRRTGDDKNLVDRYIIQQIGRNHSDTRSAQILQTVLRRAWERRHARDSFVEYLPKRLARFRQYRDIPFPTSKVAEDSDEEGGAVSDTVHNIVSAIRAGQVPVHGITIAYKHKNAPIDVKPGEPMFFGMTGAGPWSDLPEMSGADTKYTAPSSLGFKPGRRNRYMHPGNTRMFRWFDRRQALREISKFIKDHPDNPVYAFGHSYGGTAISDVVSKLPHGSVRGMVLHDPVGRFPGHAKYDPAMQVVSIHPEYEHALSPGNVVADIGGRIEKFPGAINMRLDSKSHVDSAGDLGSVLSAMVENDRAR